MKSHYIYKIELLNEKNIVVHNYFGKRSCSVIPEQDYSYIGSPKTAKEIIKNWTKEYIKKTILQVCNNEKRLAKLETKIIREHIKDKPKNLNYHIPNEKFFLTQEQQIKAGENSAKARLENTTPEQRSEAAKKAAKTRLANTTPEWRSEAAKKAAKTRLANTTPEWRSEIGKKANKTRLEKYTPEQISEFGKKANKTLLEKYTPEQRSEIAKKSAKTRLANYTPEWRSEASKKGHQTRKLNQSKKLGSYSLESLFWTHSSGPATAAGKNKIKDKINVVWS